MDLGGGQADPRWLHVEDAVQAVERALAFEPAADGAQTGWWVYHVVGGGTSGDSLTPRQCRIAACARCVCLLSYDASG